MPPKPKSKLKQKKFRDGVAHKLDRLERRQLDHGLLLNKISSFILAIAHYDPENKSIKPKKGHN